MPLSNPEEYLKPPLDGLMKKFAPDGTRQLLARFLDPVFRRSLTNRRDPKRLAALLRQFTVAVGKKVAASVATRTPAEWLWVLDDATLYSEDTGLAHLGGEEPDGPACHII